MYAEEGRGTHHIIDRAEMLAAGFDLKENVLHSADHCAGWLEQTARGPVPIGEFVPLGERIYDSATNARIGTSRVPSARHSDLASVSHPSPRPYAARALVRDRIAELVGES
jgi:hypothetical protein